MWCKCGLVCTVPVVVFAMFQLQKRELERGSEAVVDSGPNGQQDMHDTLAELDACKTRLQQFVHCSCSDSFLLNLA